MARRRSLKPEEEDLWHAVARTVTPRQPTFILRSLEVPVPSQPVRNDAGPRPAPAPLAAFRLGERAAQQSPGHDLRTPVAGGMSGAALQMDARIHGKMTRGKLAPEARLDLHGLTLAEAHPELTRFMLNAQARGMRLVLVITGKGSRAAADHGPIPQRQGALRHQVPLWLRQAPLGPVVLQVAEAHLRHGGAGACYVYLRKR